MSYILDALKKSEQARLHANTPLRQLLLRGEESPRALRPMWPYVAGAILLLINLGALNLWWRMPAREGARHQVNPAQVATPEKPPRQPSSPAAPAGDRSGPAEPMSPQAKPVPPALAETPLMTVKPAVPAAHPVEPPPGAEEAPRAVPTPEVSAAPRAMATGRKYAADAATSDLPENLLKELPPLVVSGVLREKGSNSLVVVNERALREGEELLPGLKVEKILERGALFSYKGYQFQR